MIQLVENEWGVFWINFKGKISLDAILIFLKNVIDKGNLPLDLKALYDFSETEFMMPPEEINNLAKKVNELTTHFNSIRTALVVNDPNITAYTVLFKQANANKNTIREIFSTTESAIDWLLYR